jgi:polyhydroxybutyrate depolymerase
MKRISVAVCLAAIACLAYLSVSASHDSGSVSAYTLRVGGSNREYLVYEPQSLSEQAPLVIFLHGGGGPIGSAYLALERSGWTEKADKEGFLVVFPDGLLEKPHEPMNLTDDLSNPYRNIRSWNDGSGVTPSARRGAPDVEFIQSMLSELHGRYNLDQNKIYVTGFSNGATMTYRLGMELPEIFAAIAPVAGLLYTGTSTMESSISLLHMVGSRDTPPGTSLQGSPPSAGSYTENPPLFWRNSLQCPDQSEITESSFIHSTKAASCKNDSEVVIYIVKGLGHEYPGIKDHSSADDKSNTTSAPDVIWNFFENHSK